MKTNSITAAVVATIIANLEARNLSKPDDKNGNGKKDEKKDPRQEALDSIFSNGEVFGCNHDDVRNLVQTITGLKIAPRTTNRYTERFLIVVPTLEKPASGHRFLVGHPVVALSLNGHAFSPKDHTRIDGVYRDEARPASEEEAKAFIDALKADSSKLEVWMKKLEFRSIAE